MKRFVLLSLLSMLALCQTAIAQCPPPGYPPPGDGCPQAPTLCTDLNGYCATLGTNNVQQAFPGCPGNALNNDEWFAFIAGSPAIDIQVVPSNCQGTNGQFGMQGAIYEGNCNGTPVATQCGCTDQPFIMSGVFVPGQVYYVVFDGCAGDICDFQVNVIQGSTLPIPPEDPSPIQGPTQVCPGAITTYSLSNQNAATFNWTLNPAIGTISGSPGGSINIEWTGTGQTQLCVTSSNPCFLGGTTCLTINSANLPPSHEYYNLCVGDCVPCAGQSFCSGTGPAGTPITLQNALGCDSVVYCHITQIPAIVTNLGMVTLCAPNTLTICGQQYSNTEFITHVCTDASWQGCDSTVNVDLAILDPQVLLEPAPVIGCGPFSEVTLSAVNSNFSQVPGGMMTMQWTGPGIVGADNGPTVNVNVAGQYCFTIVSSRGNVTCSDQDCITVTSNIQTPQTPQISGPQNPCQGTTVNYTVTPVGTPPPTGYSWLTPNNEPFTQVNATTIAVTWNSPNGGQLCVLAENDCGFSPPACIPITVSALPNLPIVTGPSTVCANNQPQVFTVSNVQPGITYNWTVPAGATYTGSGSSITVNFSNAAPGNGQVCVTAQNNCGNSQPGCASFTITAVPATPTMSGPASVCTSVSSYTYTVSNPPTGVTYNWTAPPGATITGSGASVSINFNGASSGQVCVTAQNSCGTSALACQAVQVTTAPTGTISGAGAFCEGSGETVDLTITLTGTGPWDVSYALNNGTPVNINVTTSPYTLTVGQAGTYTLTSVGITNANCLGTTSGSAVVTQNPAPVATLTGSGSICEGSNQSVPLTISLTGTGPWTVGWTLDGIAQAPFPVPASPFIWNIGEAQAGNITLTSVVDANGCDGTTTGSAIVTVNDAPTVSNISADCESTNQFFIVTFTINGGDPASYSITPSNGTLVGNVFTSNQIPTGSGYSFVVTDVNDCNPVTVAQNAVICNCESEVGSMDAAQVEICGDGPATIQYDPTGQNFDGNDTLAFVLHNGSGLSIVPPILSTSGTPTVSFSPASMTYGTTYYLSAVVGDNDGSGSVNLNDPCLQVAQGTPIVFNEVPTATLSGTDAVCDGDVAQLTVTFTGVGPWSITYDDGAGNVQTLNGITQNPYILAISPSATTTYCLTATSDNNCLGTASGCGTVTVNTAVVVTGLNVVCNPTSTAYTVSFTISGGDPSTYSVTGAPGNIVGNVFTSDPIPSGTGYSLIVDDANSCAPQTVAQTLVDCDCTTNAGSMSSVLVEVCGDGPATLTTSTGVVTDADDIVRYVLRPDNFAQLGTILATNNSPTFSFIPGTMSYGTTYYVSAIAGNDDGTGQVDVSDPCLDVSAPSTPVVFYEIPTAVLSGTQSICEGDVATLSVQLTGQAPWTLVYQGTTGGPITVTANNSPFQIQVTPTTTTTYSLVSVANATCPGTIDATSVTVSVNNPPSIANLLETCDPTGQTFVVTFEIQGGDQASYFVMPTGTLVGNLYTSNPLPDGSNYTYDVDDANGCGPTIVTGSYLCNCTTDAGSMSPIQLNLCVDDMAMATAATGSLLDPNDILVYYLHTGNSNTLGTVIGTSATPNFNFNPGTMTPGTVYYISAVAGNNNGTGGINLQDPCLDVSVGTPVVFNALPTISIAGSTTICQGESAQLTLTLTGTGPFTVNYTVNGMPQSPQVIPTSGTFPLPAITTTTTVTLVSITDNGTGCSNTSTQSASVTVNPNVDAGTSLGDVIFCEGGAQTFDLDDQITGASPGGQWTGPGGVVSAGIVNAASFTAGTYVYTYSVQGTGNCPDDMVTVNLVINAGAVADAGPDEVLTCDILTVGLGGPNTTSGAIYSWTGGTVSNPSTANTVTNQPGTYTLTVDDQGCVSTDVVVITQSASIPNMSIVISDVSCFGDNDGFVEVDSVWGGVGPYMYSVDGAAYSSSTLFSLLGPGQHTVSVVDAGGCEGETAFDISEPVEVTVEIVGNFAVNNSNVIDLGDELVLSILSTPSSSELDSILWSTQGLDSCQNCPAITVSPTQQTTYTVLVDEGGCAASDDLTVVVKKDRPVYIPNAFSPNDDGLNDVFTIYAGKSVSSIKSFLVFDRWGETMYEQYNFVPNDPLVGWNGRFREQRLQPAVFTWFAEIEFTDGRVELYKGSVSLVR